MSTTEQGNTSSQPELSKAGLDVDLTIDMTFTWANTLSTLLALIETGNGEGRRFARHEFSRMAAAADLGSEVLAHLDILVKDGQCRDPVVHTLLCKARSLTQSDQASGTAAPIAADPEATTITGALDTDAAISGCGVLAKQSLGKDLALEVCYSARGFYIGTCNEGLPFSRESVEYWPKRELAQAALNQVCWTQRDHP